MGALFAKMNIIDTTQSPYRKNIGGAMRIVFFYFASLRWPGCAVRIAQHSDSIAQHGMEFLYYVFHGNTIEKRHIFMGFVQSTYIVIITFQCLLVSTSIQVWSGVVQVSEQQQQLTTVVVSCCQFGVQSSLLYLTLLFLPG